MNIGKTAGIDLERSCYESLVIVLDTLEKCLSNEPIKDACNFDENMNVKLLLRHICQFLGKIVFFSCLDF